MNKYNIKKLVGRFGESAAAKYLMDSGYEVLQRNYKNKIGELDIVCQKDKVMHVVEVKTVIGKDFDGELVRAEEHLDLKKINKVTRVASLYLLEKDLPEDQKVSIDGLLVRLFERKTLKTPINTEFPKNIEKVTVIHIKNINVL